MGAEIIISKRFKLQDALSFPDPPSPAGTRALYLIYRPLQELNVGSVAIWRKIVNPAMAYNNADSEVYEIKNERKKD